MIVEIEKCDGNEVNDRDTLTDSLVYSSRDCHLCRLGEAYFEQ